MKKETLEEAAERIINNKDLSWENDYAKESFIKGVNWQAERTYSEDEVLELLIKCIDILGESNLSEKDSDKKVVEFFNRYRKK